MKSFWSGLLVHNVYKRVQAECSRIMFFQRLVILSKIMFGIFVFTGTSNAESWQQFLSTSIATEYDSNPAMMSSYQGKGLWRFLFDPSYSLLFTKNAIAIQTGASLHLERPSNKIQSQDRNDPSAFVNWKFQGETGVAGVGARYDEQSTRALTLNGLDQSYTDGTRISRLISANYDININQNNMLSIQGQHNNTQYKGISTLVDYVTQTAELAYNHTASEFTSPFIKISYNNYTQTVSSQGSRQYSYIFGLNWKASEQLEGSIKAGQTKIEGTGEAPYNPQGGLSLIYIRESNRFTFNTERQLVASGLGGFATTDQANGNWTYNMNDRDTSGIDLAWRRNHFITDNYLRSTGIWFQRELSPASNMRFYYFHRINDGTAVNEASSNTVGVLFSYADINF